MIGDWEYLPHVGGAEDLLASVAFAYRERVRTAMRDVVTGRHEEVRLHHQLAAGDLWAETRIWAARDGGDDSVRGHTRMLGADPGNERSVSAVRHALEHGEFELYAQPIVDLATARPVQHELLLRLRDPDGPLLQPAAFLPVAEATELIQSVDTWVARQALALAARGHPVEFNLSARSVSTPSMLEELRTGLAETGAPAGLLVVELTETALLDDHAAAEHFVREVRAMGCRVALDDFGTGFTSLAHLKRLPVDYLKIDREFVIDLGTSVASRRIVEAVVGLARGLGQLTVAEGAEDPAILPVLSELGVDLAQGFGIARPEPLVAVMGTGTAAH